MGFALDSIHAMAAPSQIIDSLDFATVHKLGDALRETGFQDKYDGIISDYRNAAALPDGEEALHAPDAEGIAEVAAGPIGRASGRERGGMAVTVWGVAVILKKKK